MKKEKELKADEKGWYCPICTRVNAPSVTVCHCFKERQIPMVIKIPADAEINVPGSITATTFARGGYLTPKECYDCEECSENPSNSKCNSCQKGEIND